jgi:hypothetical protein
MLKFLGRELSALNLRLLLLLDYSTEIVQVFEANILTTAEEPTITVIDNLCLKNSRLIFYYQVNILTSIECIWEIFNINTPL